MKNYKKQLKIEEILSFLPSGRDVIVTKPLIKDILEKLSISDLKKLYLFVASIDERKTIPLIECKICTLLKLDA